MFQKPEHPLEPYLPLLERLIGHEGRRRRLRAEEVEDLGSYVRLRLLEGNCEVLRRFEGRASVETYLAVVVQRIYLDWRRRNWGDFRPSVQASRLGDMAVELEHLWVRQALPWDHVQATLSSRFGAEASPERLEAIRAELGSQRKPQRVSEEALHGIADPAPGADEAVKEREANEARDRLSRTVQESMDGLDAEDRMVLRLHFKEEKSLRTIAAALGWDHRRVHRRLGRLLLDLRQHLVERGCTREMLLVALETPWDSEGGPPSFQKGAES